VSKVLGEGSLQLSRFEAADGFLRGLRNQPIVGRVRCRMIQVPAPLPGRPFYVNVEGGRLYVSVHDAFYLQRQGEFKRQIRLAHPDRNHHSWASSRTRNLLKARERWEAREARWYGRLGLDPPTRPPRCKPLYGARNSSEGARARGSMKCPCGEGEMNCRLRSSHRAAVADWAPLMRRTGQTGTG
jgi:hypothetical protein